MPVNPTALPHPVTAEVDAALLARWQAAGLRAVPLPGACVLLDENAWPLAQADLLLQALLAEIDWRALQLRMFGRSVDAPRLACWIGDADAVYCYSRTRFVPQPWTATTTRLREQLWQRLGLHFNGVLANLYRDGRDSMGWHSDDEPELGPAPVIASLSFGAPRTFRLRPRARGGATLSLQLGHGSLLLMAGRTQALYQHALPPRTRVREPRVNLTFRQVNPKP